MDTRTRPSLAWAVALALATTGCLLDEDLAAEHVGERALPVVVEEGVSPPGEACSVDDAGSFTAPSSLRVELGRSHARLEDPLRKAAATRDARQILMRAVQERLLFLRRASGASSTRARAYADLAVTGRAAYAHFRALRPSDAALTAWVRSEITAGRLAPRDATEAEIRSAAGLVLDRAYNVAWALRGPTDYRIANRARLGWIAVSGEDDAPHRPVNVPSAEYPQYDVRLSVNGRRGPVPVTLRSVVASAHEGLDSATFHPRHVPPERPVRIPDGDELVLYIPGHGSRAEEALHMAPHLIADAAARGRRLTVISIDLPSAAYASRVEHTAVADPATSRHNVAYPLLDFIEETVVAFVAELERQTPGASDRIIGVMGGSLGGNMTLRLARSDSARYPWLRNAVAWSPASVWDSWGPAVIGIPGDGEYYDFAKHEAVRITRDRYNASEDQEWRFPRRKHAREWFFDDVFGPPIIFAQPVAERWWREGWPCKAAYIAGAIRSMDEIYGPTQRRWHWRVAHEQLIFSHRDPDPGRTTPRYRTIRSRLLLAAGAGDNHLPEFIYDNARELAYDMPAEGRAMFLLNTGHSIHDERPEYWSSQVITFLMGPLIYLPWPLPLPFPFPFGT